MNRKLGKLPAVHDPRTLRLAKYITELPPAPPFCDWGKAVTVDWNEMGNDEFGDCTCAAAGHLIMNWTANGGSIYIPADISIIKAYVDVGGYVPGDPSTDNGAVELDVLNYWRNTGIAGHMIGAFAATSPAHQEHIKQAIYLFEGVYIGLNLPLSAKEQDVWDATSFCKRSDRDTPGSWGGHAVPVLGYDTDGLTCITWGQPKRMTWAFWKTYCDEAYAILSQDQVNGTTGLTASGFKLDSLNDDLAAVKD
jgi:hypothetical protein